MPAKKTGLGRGLDALFPEKSSDKELTKKNQINKEQTEKVNENKNKPQTNNRRHNNNFHYRPKNKK